jgi:hypothetical protein
MHSSNSLLPEYGRRKILRPCRGALDYTTDAMRLHHRIVNLCNAVEPGNARLRDLRRASVYLTRVSILNIGMYIEMMMTPTMSPTPIIMIGSTIEVSDCTDASTSSS